MGSRCHASGALRAQRVDVPRYTSPKDPLPILRPMRYLPFATRMSMVPRHHTGGLPPPTCPGRLGRRVVLHRHKLICLRAVPVNQPRSRHSRTVVSVRAFTGA